MNAAKIALIVATIMCAFTALEQALMLMNAMTLLDWRSELNPPLDDPRILAEQYAKKYIGIYSERMVLGNHRLVGFRPYSNQKIGCGPIPSASFPSFTWERPCRRQLRCLQD
jgi:hypothetical protein